MHEAMLGFLMAIAVLIAVGGAIFYIKFLDLQSDVRTIGHFLAALAKHDKQIPVENPQTLDYLQSKAELLKRFQTQNPQ